MPTGYTECIAGPQFPSRAESLREVHIHPNRSLNAAGAVASVGLIGLAMLGVSSYFARLGGWFVLPFAGAELLLLGWAARRVWLAASVQEAVRFGGGRVQVRLRDAKGDERTVWDSPLAWTRILLQRDVRGWYPSRLLLRYAGGEIEVGRCLIEEERKALAERLAALSDGGERPVP